MNTSIVSDGDRRCVHVLTVLSERDSSEQPQGEAARSQGASRLQDYLKESRTHKEDEAAA
jgi:hypothetical protein